MEEKYLPIGTIVLLNGATKELMIIGYCGVDVEKNELYDYTACVYPEGYVGSNINLLFNHNQIDKVINKGFMSDKCKTFVAKLSSEHKDKTNAELLKGFVDRISEFSPKEKDKKPATQSTGAVESEPFSFGDNLY